MNLYLWQQHILEHDIKCKNYNMMGLKYRLNHNCARSCYKWTSVCCKNTEVECLNEKKAKAGQMNGKPGLCKEIRNEAKQNFDINISSVSLFSPGIPLLCRFCFLQLGSCRGQGRCKGAWNRFQVETRWNEAKSLWLSPFLLTSHTNASKCE